MQIVVDVTVVLIKRACKKKAIPNEILTGVIRLCNNYHKMIFVSGSLHSETDSKKQQGG